METHGALTFFRSHSSRQQQHNIAPHLSPSIPPHEPYTNAQDTSGFMTPAHLGVQTVKRGRTAMRWRDFALFPEDPWPASPESPGHPYPCDTDDVP